MQAQQPSSGAPTLGLGGIGAPQQRSGYPGGSWFTGLYNRGRAASQGVNFPLAFVVILTLALFGISVFVVYRVLVTTLKTTTLLEDPTYLLDTTPTTVASTKLPALNGREYAVAFWMYSTGVANQTAAHPEFITFKGSGSRPVISVVQDKVKNRIYIVLLTDATNTESTSDTTASAVVDRYIANSATPTNFVVIPVDYIPLQRWVNVCMVVDQDVATVYMDGDIYNVHVTSQQVGGTAAARSMFRDPTGGDVQFNSGTGRVRAYLSRVQFFNYALSVYHAQTIYKSGPTSSGALAWLGLANYKLQWPVVEST